MSREKDLQERIDKLTELMNHHLDEADKFKIARGPLERQLRQILARDVETSEAPTVPPDLMKRRVDLQDLLIFFQGDKIGARTGWKPLQAYLRQVKGKVSHVRKMNSFPVEEELLDSLVPPLTEIKNLTENHLKLLVDKILSDKR